MRGGDTPPTFLPPPPWFSLPRALLIPDNCSQPAPLSAGKVLGVALGRWLLLRRRAATAGVAQLFQCGNGPSSQLRLPHLPPPSRPSLPSAAPDAAAAAATSSQSQPPASSLPPARPPSLAALHRLSRVPVCFSRRRRPWQSRHRRVGVAWRGTLHATP